MNEKVVNGVTYSVGERVTIVDPEDNRWGGPIGLLNEVGDKVFVITSIEDQGFVVHAPGEDNGLFFGYWVDFTNVRKESAVNHFNIGARVSYKDNDRVGVVLSTMDSAGDYRVEFVDDTLSWRYVHQSDLVLAEDTLKVDATALVSEVQALIEKHGAENVKRTVKFLSRV
jgi:hypothetical protein